MREINMEKVLLTKRREKKITQEELAVYMGVSKASVSKWETGQSYPDITFLPRLAAYFNISIDELMGYEPQMVKEDIEKLYRKLSADFAAKDFEEVYESCHAVIQKYYACFPLLLQMTMLYMNHFMLAPNQGTGQKMLTEARQLCRRVQSESGDVKLSKEALQLEAVLCLFVGKPEEVVDLLGEEIGFMTNESELVAQAYQLMGKTEKAIGAFQISSYQHLLALLANVPNLLLLNADKPEKAAEILRRGLAVGEIYQVSYLSPNTMIQIYLTGAQLYCSYGNTQKALELLEGLLKSVEELFPCILRGDEFFDAIDGFFDTFGLSGGPPREEKVIRESMLQAVTRNPAFAPLENMPEFKKIVRKFKKILEAK